MSSALQTLFRDRLEEKEVAKFMTFPNEEFILATREHYVLLLFRVFQHLWMTLLVSTVFAGVGYFIFRQIEIPSAIFFVCFLAGSGVALKEIVHWYLHVYIITTKKLLEVRYSPLLSEAINSVLLDQVRCTEIDADLNGIISEQLNLGNVSITFDRPTHQDFFVIKNVRAPRAISNLLSLELHKNAMQETQNLWVRKNGNLSYVGRVPYGPSQPISN